MNWIILELPSKDGHEIVSSDALTQIGVIMSGKNWWEVRFKKLSKFYFRTDSFSSCVGYVRGVERAIMVVGEELGYGGHRR